MSRPVYTSAQLRAIDAHTIHDLGVPSLALMELAGRAVASVIVARHRDALAGGAVIVAGRGNNGGDGYVIARHLHSAGLPVTVLGMAGAHSPDCAVNRAAAAAAGVPITESLASLGDFGLVIDALVGTGLSAALRGLALERVRAMAAWGRPVVAVDMPSGLCGDSGQVLGAAVSADTTVSFEFPRVGQLLEPGAGLVGRLVIAGIGLQRPPESALGPPALHILSGAAAGAALPQRGAADHKGRSGHLGVVAGSPERAGAAALVCNAALRSGCGLVTLIASERTLPRLSALGPEVMVQVAERATPDRVAGFDALAVGPGRGTAPAAGEELRALWRGFPGPAVFDADGLTALVGVERSTHPRCITPHPGEAGRLLGLSPAQVQADRLGAVRALAAMAPALLKGRHTLISAGLAGVRLIPTGTRHLATAGSGDVLTGIVGALLARGLGADDALSCGAFVHGMAGEICGPGLIAGDLVGALKSAFAQASERGDGVDYWPLLSR